MEITDELLISLIARLIKVEATAFVTSIVTLQELAKPHPRRPFENVWDDVADLRQRYVDNEITSFAVQFPQFEKHLRDYVSVTTSDLKDLCDDVDRDTGTHD